MRRGLLGAACSVLAVIVTGQPVSAQSDQIGGGYVHRPTFSFYWATRLEPPAPDVSQSFGSLAIDGSKVIDRIMLDRSRQIYFGYEVLVEPLGTNSYRLTFGKLLMSLDLKTRMLASQITLDDPSSPWTLLPAPSFPKPQTIQAGDVIGLDLLVNKSTGQKIVDYVTVQEPSQRFDGFEWVQQRQFAFAPGTPRDFRVDDAALRLESPRLTINGKLDESSLRVRDTAAGTVVWFYAGGRGRFILSLLPRKELGFRKAGEIRGSSLNFTVGKDTFTLRSAGPIAPGRAPFNLYVLHDPAWKPSYPHANLSVFVMDGADRADLLVKPRP
jgi:hypothetical protein